jgi:hypothetical protein
MEKLTFICKDGSETGDSTTLFQRDREYRERMFREKPTKAISPLPINYLNKQIN